MSAHQTPATKSQVTPRRQLDVILLTDNRDSNTQQRPFSDFRCSAFKETEVDPLEERMRQALIGESLEELSRRVSRLESRVEQLIILEEGANGDPLRHGKKKRRRFDEMSRDFKCSFCNRQYGSQTALKCHTKLKHRATSSADQ